MIAKLFDRLGVLCTTWPRHVLVVYALSLLATVPLILHLPLESDVRDTLPDDMARAMTRRNALFGTYDLAFLLLRSTSERQRDLLACATDLQQRLSDSALIRRVEFGYPTHLIEALNTLSLDYAPLFVRPEDLDDFDRLLTPQGIRDQLHKTLLQLSAMGSSQRDSFLSEDPLQLRRFVFARLAALRGTFRFAALSPYYLSPDGTALLVKVEGQASVHDMAAAKATVALLQQSSNTMLAQPPCHGLTLQATGGYFFAAESERVIRGDMMRSIHLAIVSISVLLTLALRRWGVLLYGPLPTLLSLVLALGLFAALRPQLNALTLGCAASLIGFGVDYTIHVLRRCFVEQGRGLNQTEALRLTIRETGGGLLSAALTAIVAFVTFLTAEQHFLRDMGLLASLGVAMCLLLSVTLLPALLMCLPQRPDLPPPRPLGVAWLTTGVLRFTPLVLGLSGALSLAASLALLWWPPGFETDLRHIHAAHSPTLQVQEDIATLFGGSQEPLTLMLEDATETEVLDDLQRLQPALDDLVADGLLAAVTSPALFYPSLQQQQKVLRRLQAKQSQHLLTVLTASLEETGFDLASLQDYITRMRHALERQQSLDLASFRALGFDNLLQPFLAHDASGAVGLALLFPTTDLWTQQARQTITKRLTQVLASHGLHGTLESLYTISAASAAEISRDFRRITFLAALSILTIISVQFRRLTLIGLVLLPVGCGMLWTAGVFAVSGFKLNFMNIAILPMLLGIGIDYGIYIVHHFQRQERRDVQEAMQGTGAAIGLSALTTLLAFGTLALSTNQGIASVGVISLVGILSCLLAALCTLPAAMQLWLQRRG